MFSFLNSNRAIFSIAHSKHDLDVVVNGQGLAPHQRAFLIIEKCPRSDFKDTLHKVGSYTACLGLMAY